MSNCTKYTKFSRIKIIYETSVTDIATLPQLAFKFPFISPIQSMKPGLI